MVYRKIKTKYREGVCYPNCFENKQNNYLDNSLKSNKHISCNILKIFPPMTELIDKNTNLKDNTK